MQGTIIHAKGTTMKTMPSELWLEVSNVHEGFAEEAIYLQLKGDKCEPKPEWWPVAEELKVQNLAQRIFEAIDKKRTVLACLKCNKNGALQCTNIRIMEHSDVAVR